MQAAPWPVSGHSPRRSVARARSGFYTGIAVLMTVIVITGFWPSYYGPLLRGAASRPWVLHLHGAIFLGWMVLLVAQVALVARGRTAAHRKLGTFGIAYGFLVLVMGLVVSFASPLLHLKAGEWDLDQAAGFLIIPLGDMAMFGGFFGTAMLYRRKPEIHKRLILLATVALLFAAIGRLSFLLGQGPIALVVWLSPLLVGIGYDGFVSRRLHPTYLIGLVILLIGFTRIFFEHSDSWLKIGRVLLRPLM
jgi:hypothetical protein